MTHRVHHVPGRLRIRIPEIKRNEANARTFTAKVIAIPGVRSAEANMLTGSLLVHYDTRCAMPDHVLSVLGIEPASPEPRAIGDSGRLGREVASAVLWYAAEKAIERAVPLMLGALL